MTLRILTTGSRTFLDRDAVADGFAYVARRFPDIPISDWVVIHGDQYGADTLCKWWAEENGATPEPHPANWGRGRKAGFIRNQEMVDSGAEFALGFAMPCSKHGCKQKGSHISHGTHDCLTRITAAHIPRFVTWRGFG